MTMLVMMMILVITPSLAIWSKERVDATLLVSNCVNASYIALLDGLMDQMNKDTWNNLYRAKSLEFFSIQINKGVFLCDALHATANYLYRDLRWAHQTSASLYAYKEKMDPVDKTQVKSLNPWDDSIEPSMEHINRLLKQNFIRNECNKELNRMNLTNYMIARQMTTLKACLREKRKDAVKVMVAKGFSTKTKTNMGNNHS